MKITALRVLLVVSIFVLIHQTGCKQTETGQSASGTSATATPVPEKIDEAAVEAELLRVQRDWPRAVREKDVEALRRLQADDIIIVYPDGTVGTKEQELKDIESGAFTVDSWEMMDLKVRILNADTAGVVGRSIVKGKYKAAEDRVSDIDAQYRFANTYARRNGEWKLVVSATAQIVNPPAETSSPEAKPSPEAAPSPSPAAAN